jgi:tetraacyldisaccharide 4'-kinase
LDGSFQSFAERVISGRQRGLRAALLRSALSLAEPVYAAAVAARNRRFDRGAGVLRLPKPVVSVGNITTGGTGKTPVVRWLCERLRDAGRTPAVLMRGYKARPGQRGDEQAMLEGLLNGTGTKPVIVHADPRRYAGGVAVLTAHPAVDVFVMDDGFQHRRLARDFVLVLVDACQPFGFGHVLPRGLLREPRCELKRASAVLITRADQGDADAVGREVRRHNETAPIYRCTHAHVGLRTAAGELLPTENLAGRKFFAFAGVGNPEGFGRQLAGMPGTLVGTRWFADHWAYSPADLRAVVAAAKIAGAEWLVTTEKDWVKIAPFAADAGLPVLRVELAVRFEGDDEARLFAQVLAALNGARP